MCFLAVVTISLAQFFTGWYDIILQKGVSEKLTEGNQIDI